MVRNRNKIKFKFNDTIYIKDTVPGSPEQLQDFVTGDVEESLTVRSLGNPHMVCPDKKKK